MHHSAGFVVTKDKKVVWAKIPDRILLAEARILEDYRFISNQPIIPNFVRVDLTPPNFDCSAPFNEWSFVLQQKINQYEVPLPKWVNLQEIEDICRKELPKWAKHHILTDGYHVISRGMYRFITGNATADIISGVAYVCNGGEIKNISGGKVLVSLGGTVQEVTGGWINVLDGGWVNIYSNGTIDDKILDGDRLFVHSGGKVELICGGISYIKIGGIAENVVGGYVEVYTGARVINAIGGHLLSFANSTVKNVIGGKIDRTNRVYTGE